MSASWPLIPWLFPSPGHQQLWYWLRRMHIFTVIRALQLGFATRLYLLLHPINIHDDVIKCKHFLCYWPFVREIHRSPVNSPHQGQWRGALMFSLSCVWINGWVNNCEAGELRRNRFHYDVSVLIMQNCLHRWTHTMKDLGELVNAGWLYSAYIFRSVWGCMCFTDPPMFQWSGGYIFALSYRLSSERKYHPFPLCHIFRGCVSNVVEPSYFVSYFYSGKAGFVSIARSTMCTHGRKHVALWPYSFVGILRRSLSSQYRVVWNQWRYNIFFRRILSSVCVRWGLFSPLACMQYMGLCLILRWLWEYLYFVVSYSIPK